MVNASKGSVNGRLPLEPQHLADLRKSGLSDETIRASGVYSDNDSKRIGRLLCWDGAAKGRGPFLCFPFRDLAGNPVSHQRAGVAVKFERVKPDRPRSGPSGRLTKYEAPVDSPLHCYFPPHTAERLKDRSRPIIVTEGEKKSLKADQEGFCCIGLCGVSCWSIRREGDDGPRGLIDDLAQLAWSGRTACICFDSDAAEKEAVRWEEWALAEALAAKGADVRVVRLPGGPDGAKVGLDDFLVAHGPDALRKLMEEARPPENPKAAAPQPAAPVAIPERPPWPTAIDQAAYWGLAGDVVRAIEPQTEADPAALLIQFLAAFGSAAGRHRYVRVEADRHYPNLFAVLVGATAKARKGTSWGRIEELMVLVDPGWVAARVQNGLSSGEGLIAAVRDPQTQRRRMEDEDGAATWVEEEVQPGVEDKRLFVQEAEFASVLKQTERHGNTLSAVLRTAWDKGRLQSITKNNPTRATDAHVAIVGHITAEELTRYLTTTEAANGFANRFLWACVRRSKSLSRGGRPVDLRDLAKRLRDAVEFAAINAEVDFAPDALAAWDAVYPDLSEGRPGLGGALAARLEAQVLRLALIYALLDKSSLISRRHLEAALALADYCERSIGHIWGDSTGDPVADQILRELRDRAGGMTATEIHALFGRNQTADRIGKALGLLLRYGLVRRERDKAAPAGGRPADRWVAVAG
jgi:hypothetical protein